MRIGEKSMGGQDCTLNGANVIFYCASQRSCWVQKSKFCSKFAWKFCTVNPTCKCVFPKWPNMICMCRVHKTFVLFIPRNSRMSSSKSTALLGSMSFPKFKEKNVIPKVNSIVAFDVTLTPLWSPKSTAPLGSMSASHPLAHPKSTASAGSMSPSYPY